MPRGRAAPNSRHCMPGTPHDRVELNPFARNRTQFNDARGVRSVGVRWLRRLRANVDLEQWSLGDSAVRLVPARGVSQRRAHTPVLTARDEAPGVLVTVHEEELERDWADDSTW